LVFSVLVSPCRAQSNETVLLPPGADLGSRTVCLEWDQGKECKVVEVRRFRRRTDRTLSSSSPVDTIPVVWKESNDKLQR